MSRKITLVAATEMEIQPTLEFLHLHAQQHAFQTFHVHGMQIDILYSGIGILQTTYHLTDYLGHRHPDLWIQAGIGGAFDPDLEIGQVLQVKSELIAGFGAEDRDGRILSPFDLGWSDADAFPFSNGVLENPHETLLTLPFATGMTTFHSHGNQDSIDQLRHQPHAQIENMEGAAFFFVSLIRRIPFVSLRAISNLVEPRDTSRWHLDDSIQNLNQVLQNMLVTAKYNPDKLIRPVSV